MLLMLLLLIAVAHAVLYMGDASANAVAATATDDGAADVGAALLMSYKNTFFVVGML